VASIQSYVYRRRMDDMQRIWPFNRKRAFQIVKRAFDLSGIPKPPHVGAVHVLRHSGALARLAETGNPKAVQDQLRHVDAAMTIRYMKTLQAQESLRIQQGVDFRW
jgi:integrase